MASVPSVYVASAEGSVGKSTVALGMVEQLSRRVGRVDVFQPIVPARGHPPEAVVVVAWPLISLS